MFAMGLAAVATVLLRSRVSAMRPTTIWLYLFLATVSHGLLDAITDGGRGVAFFAPFSSARYFFPFRPIRVWWQTDGSLLERALVVLASELRWVWIPSCGLAALGLLARRLASSRRGRV
jgi:inner membrane protein